MRFPSITSHRVTVEDESLLLTEAMAIADLLDEHSVHGEDGTVAWSAPRNPTLPEGAVRRVDPYLHAGTVGIAVFLAALTKVTGRTSYGDLALGAMAPLRRGLTALVEDPDAARSDKLPIGGFVGIGSLIYAFLKIATWLDEPELVDEAHALSCLITPERIARDRRFDVVSGSAGAILALSALDRVAPGPNQRGVSARDIAEDCARHLVTRRTPYDGAPRAWVTVPGHPPLGGFAHGAAGISYALFRLYDVTGDEPWRRAAAEGIAFERHLFSPRERNWQDARSRRPRFPVHWCQGAPGIALARLGGLEVADGVDIRQDIDVGLETTRAQSLTRGDHLCCGNFGRAEVLLYAYQRLGDREWSEAAAVLIRQIVDRARARGGFAWQNAGKDGSFHPGLLTGAAGVGYGLLRHFAPQTLPCLLLLE